MRLHQHFPLVEIRSDDQGLSILMKSCEELAADPECGRAVGGSFFSPRKTESNCAYNLEVHLVERHGSAPSTTPSPKMLTLKSTYFKNAWAARSRVFVQSPLKSHKV